MSNIKIIGANVPNMPWQDRPEGSGNLPVWRYNKNTIIGRNPAKGVARIFNSAVMPYKDSFIGVFSVIFNLFLTEGTPVFHIWKLTVTKEGIYLAAFMMVRLIFLIMGSSLMTLTTTPTH